MERLALDRPSSPVFGEARHVRPMVGRAPSPRVQPTPVFAQPQPNSPRTGVVLRPQLFKNAIVFVQGQVAVLKKPNEAPRKKEGILTFGEGEEVTVVHLPSGDMHKALVKTSEFAEEAIAQIGEAHRQRAEDDVDANYLTSVWYAASDASAITRNIEFFRMERADPGVTLGLGYTSAGGLITGPLVMNAAFTSLERANQINDIGGQQIAKVKIVRGVAETTSGAVMAGVRTVGLMGIDSTSKTIIVANTVLGITSTVTSSLLYTMLIVQFSMMGMKAYTFMNGLNEYLDRNDTEGAYQFLKSQLEMSEDDWTKAEEVIAYENRGQLYGLIKDPVEDVGCALTAEERAEVRSRVSDIPRGYAEIGDRAEAKHRLEMLLAKEVYRMKQVKEAKYLRRAGIESLTLLKREMAQPTTIQNRAKIVETAHDESRFNTLMYAFLVITCIIGIASFILATVFTGGGFLILGFALMLAMNVMMTAADGYGLFQAVESLQKSSTKDRAILVGMILLTIAAMVIGSYFAAGTSAMIVVLIVGFLMLSIQAGGMAWAYHKYKPIVDPGVPS